MEVGEARSCGRSRTVREHQVDARREREDVRGEPSVLQAGGGSHRRPDGEDTVAAVGGGVATEEGIVVGQPLPPAVRVLQVEGVGRALATQLTTKLTTELTTG